MNEWNYRRDYALRDQYNEDFHILFLERHNNFNVFLHFTYYTANIVKIRLYKYAIKKNILSRWMDSRKIIKKVYQSKVNRKMSINREKSESFLLFLLGISKNRSCAMCCNCWVVWNWVLRALNLASFSIYT